MKRTNFLLIGIIVGLVGLKGTVHGAALQTNKNSENSTNINFGTALLRFYKAIQKIMPCGYLPMDLPVLAPFTMEFLPLNFSSEYLTLQGNISNMEVIGLNNFRFIKFNYDEQTNRTSYDIIFPEQQVLAEYILDTWALLAGFPINAAGQGLLNLKLIDMRIVGHFTLASSGLNSKGLRVSDFDSHFHLGNVVTNNWNDLLDISMNNFINRWESEFMLMWTQQIQVDFVNKIYAQLLLPQINDVLANLTMNQLVSFFENQSNEINMVNCILP